eukprot:CAMPEP_0176413502 /NCGR_PEP_ID=MMETSP0127-20121128/4736_1 /TAXON_ID=938130 /ORGANISM="Platyophrya macrostoma, Strain WH" /LENGTH=302 /DNA_ID=CAMNT_0017793293 /DNA_START=51 /DNA_END=959 /DNA_ORIENTATION=+
MSDEITSLELGNHTLMTYRVHPSVSMQIMDALYRKTTRFVVGTLLGRIETTHIEITNCFPVPVEEYSEDEETKGEDVSVDASYNAKMVELNKKIYPGEVVIGWFSDLKELDYDAVKIHEFYLTKESGFVGKAHVFTNPLILLVKLFDENNVFNMKGFISQPLSFCRDSIKIFQEIALTYNFEENKTQISPLWLDNQGTTSTGSTSNPFELINLDSLEDQLKDTVGQIEKISEFVKKVNSGKEEADPEIGKAIKKMISTIPNISAPQFKDALAKYRQDVMMIMYLTNLANSQVLLSEKLNKIV